MVIEAMSEDAAADFFGIQISFDRDDEGED